MLQRSMGVTRVVAIGLVVCVGLALAGCRKSASTSPRAAAIAFMKAANAGDSAAMRQNAVGTDAEFDLAEGLGKVEKNVGDFSDAITKKFGDSGKQLLSGSPDFVGQFEAAEEKINGDNALLVIKEAGDAKIAPSEQQS